MQVRLLTDRVGPVCTDSEGDVIDVADDEGRRMVAGGQAERVGAGGAPAALTPAPTTPPLPPPPPAAPPVTPEAAPVVAPAPVPAAPAPVAVAPVPAVSPLSPVPPVSKPTQARKAAPSGRK